MNILTYLIHCATDGAGIAGVLYAGSVSVIMMTAVAAPTPERRRDARAVLKLILPSRRLD